MPPLWTGDAAGLALSLVPPTWLQELAAVGEALAGPALLLAIWIFVRIAARLIVPKLTGWRRGLSGIRSLIERLGRPSG